MKKIKKSDMVVVLTGRDKGRTGKVLKLVVGDRVLVEGINVVKKCMRPNPHKGTQGGIVEKEASIHVSNVALLNPSTKKADRVGFKMMPPAAAGEKARKVRYFKSNNELVDVIN